MVQAYLGPLLCSEQHTFCPPPALPGRARPLLAKTALGFPPLEVSKSCSLAPAPRPSNPMTADSARPGFSCPVEGSLSKGEPRKKGKLCPHLRSSRQVLPAPDYVCFVTNFLNAASSPWEEFPSTTPMQPFLLLPWP